MTLLDIQQLKELTQEIQNALTLSETVQNWPKDAALPDLFQMVDL